MTEGIRSLAGHRVVITGANGFLGRALVTRCAELGAAVSGIDLAADPRRSIVAGDITAPTAWAGLLDGCSILIHTAALVTNNVAPAEAWHANVVGTRRALDAAAASGVERFVYISTMGVARFGQRETAAVERSYPGRDLDEQWPLMPVGNPYTDTKIAAEHAVLAAHGAGEVPATIVRPADVYGPGCRPWVLEPLAAIRTGRFLLPAHGLGLFTIVYIDDLVEGILAAAVHGTGGHIFHLGGEHPVTTGEYFGRLYAMLGRSEPPRSFSTPVAVSLAEAARLGYRLAGRHTELGRGVMEMLAKTRPVSNTKAREVLGWSPEIDLDEGMARTEAWLRSQGLLETAEAR